MAVYSFWSMKGEIEHRLCCPGKELRRVWWGTIADPKKLAAGRDRLRASARAPRWPPDGPPIRQGLPHGSRSLVPADWRVPEETKRSTRILKILTHAAHTMRKSYASTTIYIIFFW